jgi:gliding motility-associated-like protein
MRIIRFYLFAIAAIFSFTQAQAQLLPPNQPEQNACNALQLCGNTFFTPYSYQGEGTVTDLTTTPCFSPESNSVWLKLVVSAPGTIVFTITPVVTADDYDFAIANITNGNCSSIAQTQVIRCNFNNNQPVFNNGIVGLNSTSTLTSVAGGTTGSPFLQQITAAAGDVYLIMINNFGSGGGPSSGFTINFAGSTAVFFDNTPPHFNNLSSSSACNYKNSVTVHLNTPIACNSIAANGSDFQLTPSGTIASASGINCSGSNGYTQDVVVNFAPSLNPGTYALHAKLGTDNNTMLNLCGTAVPVTDSLVFTIAPSAVYTAASLSCTTLTVNTNIPVKCSSIAANGSDFNITGPGTATVASAVGVACSAAGFTNTITLTLANPIAASGTYTLHSQNGTDGNTLQDSCNTNQAINNQITFNAAAKPQLQLTDSLITCSNTGVILPLVITNNDATLTYTYQWVAAAGLNNATIPQPLANPVADAIYVVTVGSTNPSMCTSKDSVFVHNLQGFDILNNDTAICEGSSFPIVVNGSDEYTYTWTPTTGVSNPNIKNPTLSPDAPTVYTLTASHAGCNDSSANISVDVQPNPTGIKLYADRTSMCQYDTIVLHAIANPASFNFTYTWSPAGDMLYPGGPNNAYFGDTSVTVVVSASTPIGCAAKDSIRLTVFPGNFSSVNTNDTGMCPPMEVIQLLADGGVSYIWSPAYGLNNATIANPLASPQTTTEYLMIAKDIHGCTDSQMVKVAIYPAAVIAMPDSVNIYPGESYHIEPGTNALYFKWFPPSGLSADNISDPLARPEVRTRYFVTASTEKGCSISDSIDILVKQTVIDIPNAFAPNGDGVNSTFKPSKRGIAQLKSFNIFNRWGQKVFESTNIDKGWDGTLNDKPQPIGVYIYTIEAVTDSGQIFTRQGNVTLIR